MVRITLALALFFGLFLGALPTAARQGTPAADFGPPVVIYNSSLQVVGEVSVTEVVDPFEDYDFANSQPQRGFRWVMAVVRLKAGEQPISTSGYFQIVDNDGFVSNQTYITRSQESTTAYPDFYASELPAGQEATGAVFFQVFASAEIASIEYAPDYAQSILVADLREAPVKAGTVIPVDANDGSPMAEISVVGVLDPVTDYDPSYAPQRGFRFVGVAISFTNTSSHPFMLDPSRVSIVDREGFTYSSYGVYRTPAGEAAIPSLTYAEVAPGATVTGLVSIELINGAFLANVIYSPPGDRRVRIAEYGPDDPLTPPELAEVPTPTPVPTADPACAEAIAWGALVESSLPDTTAAFDAIGRAAAGEQVDPQTIRDGADQVRAVAQALAGLETPAIAQAASEQLVAAFNSAADQIDAIADAVEAGDTAAIQAASDEIGRLLFEELSTGAFADLIARCPGLDE